MKKTIVLTIAGTDFSFSVTAKDHSDFIDAMARGGSVTAASYNFAMRTIDGDQKDDFKKLLESAPGAEVQIAGELKTEFAPVLEIAVKK